MAAKADCKTTSRNGPTAPSGVGAASASLGQDDESPLGHRLVDQLLGPSHPCAVLALLVVYAVLAIAILSKVWPTVSTANQWALTIAVILFGGSVAASGLLVRMAPEPRYPLASGLIWFVLFIGAITLGAVLAVEPVEIKLVVLFAGAPAMLLLTDATSKIHVPDASADDPGGDGNGDGGVGRDDGAHPAHDPPHPPWVSLVFPDRAISDHAPTVQLLLPASSNQPAACGCSTTTSVTLAVQSRPTAHGGRYRERRRAR